MGKQSRKYDKLAPVVRCHTSTAVALGAVMVRRSTDARRLGHACIPIRGHNGSCWLWPLEKEFLAAIERH